MAYSDYTHIIWNAKTGKRAKNPIIHGQPMEISKMSIHLKPTSFRDKTNNGKYFSGTNMYVDIGDFYLETATKELKDKKKRYLGATVFFSISDKINHYAGIYCSGHYEIGKNVAERYGIKYDGSWSCGDKSYLSIGYNMTKKYPYNQQELEFDKKSWHGITYHMLEAFFENPDFILDDEIISRIKKQKKFAGIQFSSAAAKRYGVKESNVQDNFIWRLIGGGNSAVC